MRVGYKKTEIGEIPEEWEVVNIGNNKYFSLIMGQSPKSNAYNTNGLGIPFMQGNIEFDRIYAKPKMYTKEITKKVTKNDILISVRAPVGETNLAPYDICIGRGLAGIRVNKEVGNYLFYFYYLKYISNKIQNFSSGSTFKAIGKDEIKRIILAVPPLPEQQKIAEILSTVDEGIEVCDKKIEKLERYKKGKMQQLLTKGIGHKKFKKSEIGEIPEGWEVVKVKNLFEKAKNKRIIGIKTKEYLKEGKFPIIDQSNKFISGYTNDENRVYKGDLPIIIFGDHTKIFKFLDFPFALGADGTKILILKKNYNIKYIYYILNFIKFQNEGYRRHIDILREKVIAISSNSIEQQKIAEVLSTIDELIELEKQKKEKLERYKKGLMNDLLTGRKRVKIN